MEATEFQSKEQEDPIVKVNSTSFESHLINQSVLVDLVQNLKLSKKQAELLSSLLKGISFIVTLKYVSSVSSKKSFKTLILQKIV